MATSALPSCSDPRPRAPGEVLLSWGQRPDGTLVHIADVVSGLSCNCICPGCGARLAAAKGRIRQHYFRHHNAAPCRQAYESALHKLAKEVLNEELELMLPDVQATVGTRTVTAFSAERFHFDDAVLEHRLGDIVADVIVRHGTRELLVEMAVTHWCGPEKIARIEALGLPCVEIDLSRLPRDASRADVARALLGEAPRSWVHNPKIALATERLRETIAQEEEAQRLSIEKAARDRRRKYAPIIDAIWEHRDNPITFRWPDSDTVREVVAAGFEARIGKSVEGDFCIALSPREWQSRLISQFIIEKLEQRSTSRSDFPATDAFNCLQKGGLLRAGVPSFVDGEALREITRLIPEFVAPFRIVDLYLGWLADQGVLTRMGKRYALAMETRQAWNERRARRVALQSRAADLRAAIERILRALPEEESAGFSTDRWWHEELLPFGMSPAMMFETDHDRLTTLSLGIERIERMLLPHGPPAQEAHGLPVAAAVARAQAQIVAKREQAAREEEQKLAEERRWRAARLSDLARDGLGPEAGDWLATPLAELGGKAPRAAAEAAEDGLRRGEALLAMAALVRQQRLSRDRYRADLMGAAAGSAKPDHARLFLTTSSPKFQGRKPIEACHDEISFRRVRAAMADAIR